MKHFYRIILFFLATAFAQADDYTWRLDEIKNISFHDYDEAYGDTLTESSIVRYEYDTASFSTLSFGTVQEWGDSGRVGGTIQYLTFSDIGDNGKHIEKGSLIRKRREPYNISKDSLLTFNPLRDTIVSNMHYDDYAYDTYRNIYDEDGHLIRQIRNYDVTQYVMDQDSLAKVFYVLYDSIYKDDLDSFLELWNNMPFGVYQRKIVTQTDSTAHERVLFPYDDYKADSFYTYTEKKERYEQHRCIYSESSLYTYYSSGRKRTTTINRYSLSGALIGAETITQQWNKDSVQTLYQRNAKRYENDQLIGTTTENRYFSNGNITTKNITDLSYHKDSVWEITEVYTYTYDEDAADSTISRKERIYDRATQLDLYLKQSSYAQGEWLFKSLQTWQLVHTAQGIVAKISRNYEYQTWQMAPRDSKGFSQYYDNVDLLYRYTDDGQLIFYRDSSTYKRHKYENGYIVSTTIEPVYVCITYEDGKRISGQSYQHDFEGEEWYLVHDTIVYADHIHIVDINTADTTRTTSTQYTIPFGGNATIKEKWNAQTQTWDFVQETNYTVTRNALGAPLSATQMTINAQGVTTDATYYLFTAWDDAKQGYIRNSIGWLSTYHGEPLTHFYDAQDYIYYNKEGVQMGLYHNTCSSCKLTSEYIYGLYKSAHYDAQDRIDTMTYYAFWGEWYPIAYDVYDYLSQEGETDVATIAHYSRYNGPYYEFYYDVTDSWQAYDWRCRLAEEDTTQYKPLTEMHLAKTDTLVHTYYTYNEAGWLTEIRTYKGQEGPVVRHPNVFTYDEAGRVIEHITYTDTLPTQRKVYFYDELTPEAIACVTYNQYSTATATWSRPNATIVGTTLYDEQGRVSTTISYKAATDYAGMIPSERYDYIYADDNREYLQRDYYKWINEEWVCQTPDYHGKDLNTIQVDEQGNMTSRSEQEAICGGEKKTNNEWIFDYDKEAGGDEPVLSPASYGVTEGTIYSLFNAHPWHARPLRGQYTVGNTTEQIEFQYSQLREITPVLPDTTPVQPDTTAIDTTIVTPPTIQYVTVDPYETTAYFTWPTDPEAEQYIIDVRRDGVIFCHLTLDGAGRLMSIAFEAPARRETEDMPATLNFLVTGLSPATLYTYTVAVLGADGVVLHVYQGQFATMGYMDMIDPIGIELTPTPPVVPYDPYQTGIDTPEYGNDATNQDGLFFYQGHILIRKGNKVYNLMGMEQ